MFDEEMMVKWMKKEAIEQMLKPLTSVFQERCSLYTLKIYVIYAKAWLFFW